MKNSLRELMKKLMKDKKAFFIVLTGLTGILLIAFSELPFFSDSSEKEVEADFSFYDCRELQRETEKLLGSVEGAGKVSVLLTLESNEERVYATDTEEKSERDSSLQSKSQHIIVDASQGETGLIRKVIYPRVRGVAVVCSGGDDPRVRSEISSLLSALFDLGSNRISIARRAEQE